MLLKEKIDSVKKGNINLVDQVEKYLNTIERKKDYNAFIHIRETQARAKAVELNDKIKNGQETGPLCGSIVAVKDNINIRDEYTTCASNILKPFRSPYNATVVEKLEAADAIIIGKTNMDEFAMGSSNENSAFGPAKNPIDPNRVPGGSSGGSAVAVATECCDTALGSETGGSIRHPASFTGTTGMKPTYGRVSRYGLVAFASSLDQIGPFGRSVEDMVLLFQQIAGYDRNDSTSVDIAVPNYSESLNKDVSGLTIGVPEEFFAEGLDDEIKNGLIRIIDHLKGQGAKIKNIGLPMTEYAIATYYILATAEASSNLARYDGVRYGHRDMSPKDLIEMYAESRSQGFGDEVKRRILLGTYVLSSGYYDAYYDKAQRVRRLIKNEYDQAFAEVDLLITPTTPTTAFLIGEKVDDPLTMYLSDIYTVSANLAGICALNVKAGTHSNGLPYGVQLMARGFNEQALFQAGDFIEKTYNQA